MANEKRSPAEHDAAAEILVALMNDVQLAIGACGPMLMSKTAGGGWSVSIGGSTFFATSLAGALTNAMASIEQRVQAVTS